MTTPIISIKRTYVKSIMFESPDPVRYFQTKDLKVVIDMNMNAKLRMVSESDFEFSMHVHARAEHDSSTVYLLDFSQVGLFNFSTEGEGSTIDEEDKAKLIYRSCPQVLIPYIRESVASLTQKAGFEPLLINPVNIEVAFNKIVGRKSQAQEEENLIEGLNLSKTKKPTKKDSIH